MFSCYVIVPYTPPHSNGHNRGHDPFRVLDCIPHDDYASTYLLQVLVPTSGMKNVANPESFAKMSQFDLRCSLCPSGQSTELALAQPSMLTVEAEVEEADCLFASF